MLSENEVKAAVPLMIYCTADWTSFQHSLSDVTYLFLEWRILYLILDQMNITSGNYSVTIG